MLIFWFRRRYAVEIHCVRQIGQHRQQIRDCHRSENEICRRDLHAKQSLSLQTKYLLTECELNFNTGRYLDHSWSISIKRIYVTTLNCANESSLRANLWIKFQTVSLWQFLGCRPIPTFLPLWMWKLVGDVHMVITSHVPSLKFIFIVVTILQARIRGGANFRFSYWFSHGSHNNAALPDSTNRAATWRTAVYIYSIYRVGQIKRDQLTFLLVTSERIYKIKWFLAGINYIEQQVTRCQLCLIERVTR